MRSNRTEFFESRTAYGEFEQNITVFFEICVRVTSTRAISSPTFHSMAAFYRLPVISCSFIFSQRQYDLGCDRLIWNHSHRKLFGTPCRSNRFVLPSAHTYSKRFPSSIYSNPANVKGVRGIKILRLMWHWAGGNGKRFSRFRTTFHHVTARMYAVWMFWLVRFDHIHTKSHVFGIPIAQYQRQIIATHDFNVFQHPWICNSVKRQHL